MTDGICLLIYIAGSQAWGKKPHGQDKTKYVSDVRRLFFRWN